MEEEEQGEEGEKMEGMKGGTSSYTGNIHLFKNPISALNIVWSAFWVRFFSKPLI